METCTAAFNKSAKFIRCVSVLTALVLTGCGGGAQDGVNNDNPNNNGTVVEPVGNPAPLVGTQAKLFGHQNENRIWVCEKNNSNGSGSITSEILEFGELPKFNRAWVRFISAVNGFEKSLYRFTVIDENLLRLTVPGINRIAPFLQSESDSRTRFLGSIDFQSDTTLTTTYVERRLTRPDIRVDYKCKASTRSRAISGEVPTLQTSATWAPDPDIHDVEGLRYTRRVKYTLTDDCADGVPVHVQFYEAFNGVLTGERWPDKSSDFEKYVITSTPSYVPIDCAPGTTYCHAARPAPPATGYWGLNPDNLDSGCDSCCQSCPLTLFSGPDPSLRFSCS